MSHPGSDGGPANPSPHCEACPSCGEAILWSPGFSKRERMAMEFMRQLLSNLPHDATVNAKDVAGDAVSLADALLETIDMM